MTLSSGELSPSSSEAIEQISDIECRRNSRVLSHASRMSSCKLLAFELPLVSLTQELRDDILPGTPRFEEDMCLDDQE